MDDLMALKCDLSEVGRYQSGKLSKSLYWVGGAARNQPGS